MQTVAVHVHQNLIRVAQLCFAVLFLPAFYETLEDGLRNLHIGHASGPMNGALGAFRRLAAENATAVLVDRLHRPSSNVAKLSASSTSRNRGRSEERRFRIATASLRNKGELDPVAIAKSSSSPSRCLTPAPTARRKSSALRSAPLSTSANASSSPTRATT